MSELKWTKDYAGSYSATAEDGATYNVRKVAPVTKAGAYWIITRNGERIEERSAKLLAAAKGAAARDAHRHAGGYIACEGCSEPVPAAGELCEACGEAEDDAELELRERVAARASIRPEEALATREQHTHSWRPDDERPGYAVCRECFVRRNTELEDDGTERRRELSDRIDAKLLEADVKRLAGDYERAAQHAHRMRELLLDKVREAAASGVSEYRLAEAADVTRSTVRAWLGK